MAPETACLCHSQDVAWQAQTVGQILSGNHRSGIGIPDFTMVTVFLLLSPEERVLHLDPFFCLLLAKKFFFR